MFHRSRDFLRGEKECPGAKAKKVITQQEEREAGSTLLL